MSLKFKYIVYTSTLLLLLSGCVGSNPTPAQENSLGEQQAKQVLSDVHLSNNPTQKKMLLNAGKRIAKIANKPAFKWKYYLVDNDKTANAFVLPGGKVFVYSGLFKYASTESELAAVIGHEVAHALESHGVSSANKAKVANMLGSVLSIGMAVAGVDRGIASVAEGIYSTGATYAFIKPMSRAQELDADALGLTLMAKAGYNPNAALSFWNKLGKSTSNTTSEFLSTHPSPVNRIEQIKSLIPKAMEIYKTKS